MSCGLSLLFQGHSSASIGTLLQWWRTRWNAHGPQFLDSQSPWLTCCVALTAFACARTTKLGTRAIIQEPSMTSHSAFNVYVSDACHDYSMNICLETDFCSSGTIIMTTTRSAPQLKAWLTTANVLSACPSKAKSCTECQDVLSEVPGCPCKSSLCKILEVATARACVSFSVQQ